MMYHRMIMLIVMILGNSPPWDGIEGQTEYMLRLIEDT